MSAASRLRARIACGSRRAGLRAAALALALAVGLAAAAATAADVPPGKLDQVKQAADAFSARAQGFEKTGKVPRQSDPDVAALLDVVFDISALREPPPAPFSQLNQVNDWTRAVLQVGTVYMLAGTGLTDFSQANDNADLAQLNERISRNTVDFAPEMGRYIDAQLQVTKALLESVMAAMAADPGLTQDPVRKHGLEQTQGGVTQTLGGVLTTLSIPGLADAWLLERMRALNDFGPVAAKFVNAEQRQAINGLANEVAGSLSNADLVAGLKSFAEAFAGP